MIHKHKEGDHLKIGLNYKYGRVGWKPWVAFVWCWYEPSTRTLTTKRLRVRTHVAPYIIKESAETNTISNFLMMNDLIAVPRELMEDHAPRLINYALYFNQQFMSGEISRYNG